MRNYEDHFIYGMMYSMQALGVKKIPKWKIAWIRIKRKLRRLFKKIIY